VIFGYDAGEQVLREIGNAFKCNIKRVISSSLRNGGDEFACGYVPRIGVQATAFMNVQLGGAQSDSASSRANGAQPSSCRL